MQRHVIEVRYVERCPFLASAIERVRRAVAPRQHELDIEIRLVRVEVLERSPQIRIDGHVMREPEHLPEHLAGALVAS